MQSHASGVWDGRGLMSTVIQDEGELHTLQPHNLFFSLLFPELLFELQLPKLALGFQPCQSLPLAQQMGLCGAVNQPREQQLSEPCPFSSELSWQVLPLCNR